MKDIKATVGLLTYNSPEHLERALKSVEDFEEVVIADGGSTDATLDIAKRFGAKIISQSNPGQRITDFAEERNRLVAASTRPWFIYIDSDELMSPELVSFIRTVANNPEELFDAYRVRYLKTDPKGLKPYRTYNEYYQVRLVRTALAHFERPVHERIVLPATARVGQTEAPWYVPLEPEDLSFSHFARGAWKRTSMEAKRWKPKGFWDVLHHVILHPAALVLKSLLKIPLVRIKWGREAIPVRYELLRVLYASMLSVRFGQRLFTRGV